MASDLVVRIGKNHNKGVVILRDYDGPHVIDEQFLAALQECLMAQYGEHARKVGELDHIEILNS